MKKIIIISAVLIFGYALNLAATPISDVSVFSVSGAMMEGMIVSVTYADSTPSSSDSWETIGVNTGEALADDWNLAFNGDNTYDPDQWWEFSLGSDSAAVKSFTINAIPGDTAFDILFVGSGNNLDTVGSEFGWWQGLESDIPYTVAGPTPGDDISGNVTSPGGLAYSWIFSDPITLGGVAAGDLFGKMTITFDSALSAGENFSFQVDTDNVAPVPEPATVILMGTGLAGLFGFNRRRKK